MEEGLKLKISADLSNAISALREMQREVNKTGQTAGGLGKSVGSAAAKMPNLEKNTAQATFALTNLGRVASDAPFGLIAIANNIDPLIQSFAQLKASSKESGGMLKALGASLTGGGGIVLGISLLTSAAQFAVLGFDRWKTKTAEAKEKLDEATASITDNYTQVLILVEAYKKEGVSLNERKSILSQLNNISDKYFGGLKAEQTSIEDLTRAYDSYINNLLRSFAVKQLEKDLEPFIKRLAVAQVTIKKYGDDVKKLGLDKINLRNLPEEQRAALSISGVTKYNAAVREEGIVRTEINKKIEEALYLTAEETKLSKGKTKELEKQKSLYDYMNRSGKIIEENKNTRETIRLLDELNSITSLSGQQENIRTNAALTTLDKFNIRGLSGDKIISDIDQLQILRGEADKLNKSFELTDELINTVGNEFANLFTNISKDGTKAFEDFAKAVAETTTRILINYAVTQALKTLLNSMAPGSGIAVDAASKVTGGMDFTGVVRGSDINLSSLRALG